MSRSDAMTCGATQLGVGRKVTNYRRIHNVTIRELSEKSGISTALISQLERGIGNPTLGALAALADAMEISLADLVAAKVENKDLICRREDRQPLRQGPGFYLESILVEEALNTSLSVVMIRLAPGADSLRMETHVEEECLCVLNGSLTMVLEDEEFRLNQGDSIRVLQNRPHMLRNDSEEEATAINIKCRVQY